MTWMQNVPLVYQEHGGAYLWWSWFIGIAMGYALGRYGPGTIRWIRAKVAAWHIRKAAQIEEVKAGGRENVGSHL